MANPAGSFIWYELMTPHPDGAAGFYGTVVGWTIGAQSDPAASGMDYRMIRRSDGGNAGGVLALSHEMTAGGALPCWLGYISVDNVDEAAQAIIADGGRAVMPPFDIAAGRIALLADPQGAPFYVMKPTMPEGAGNMESDVFCVDQPQRMRWNELATPDPDAATAFYTRHFGWTQEGAMDMGPLGSYRFIQKNGTGIGAIMRKPDEMPVPAWTFYIGVDDIDRAAEAVKVQGGKIIAGPHQIPGGEYSLVGTDRQGAHFGLVGPAGPAREGTAA